MSVTLAQVEREIIDLTSAEKLYLLEKLVCYAHDAVSPQSDEVWYKEAKAREEAVAIGKLNTVSWHQVKENGRKLL